MGKGRCSIRCSGTERIMEADISMQCRKKKHHKNADLTGVNSTLIHYQSCQQRDGKHEIGPTTY
uniref:Uncharacterized protein n=1 Tax=Arundo donax TaxID=35708 RepID=A0A0A9FLC0_ARUDO